MSPRMAEAREARAREAQARGAAASAMTPFALQPATLCTPSCIPTHSSMQPYLLEPATQCNLRRAARPPPSSGWSVSSSRCARIGCHVALQPATRIFSSLQPYVIQVSPHRLLEPSHVALELAAEDLPHQGIQPRQVANRFANPYSDPDPTEPLMTSDPDGDGHKG